MSKFFRIYIPFVIGFFFTSIYRTVSAVLSPDIGHGLHIPIPLMGLVTSIYFLFVAIMQLPTGVLLDKYGPRKVQSFFFTIAGIGSILFGLAEGLTLLLLGRILLGIGMAGGLMNAFTAFRLWYDKEKLPTINSVTVALGSLGAIASSKPTQLLLETISWSAIAIWLGALTIILAFITFLLVPNPPHDGKSIKWSAHLKGLGVIFSDRYFWRVAPLVLFTLGTFVLFQSFWLMPYLKHVYQASNAEAGTLLLWIAIAMILSLLLLGPLLKVFTRIGISNNRSLGAIILLAIIVQCFMAMPSLGLSFTLWFIFSFLVVFSMGWYATLVQHFSIEYAGRASTALNTMLFGGVFILQFLFGVIAKSFSNYSAGLVYTFWMLIGCQILSFLWYCFGKGEQNG